MSDLVKMGLILTVVGGVATGFMAATEEFTRDRIAEAKRQQLQEALGKVLPQGFDNQPAQDVVKLTDARLNRSGKPVNFYVARKGGVPLGSAFTVTAPDGYSGNIDVLVGVGQDGVISRIEIVAHAETPGLGDKAVKTDWPKSFEGKSLGNPVKWGVKKDGGTFDQFAGATITPRAIVAAVHRGLEVFAERRGEILAPSTIGGETAAVSGGPGQGGEKP
ncbi:MAG: RnfABCDGE type electron transport complex subunit G [Magnetococcales bacterium]|nr:RnfABCDGE type electron transport complex subunit G [Magnetococcales bacterium]